MSYYTDADEDLEWQVHAEESFKRWDREQDRESRKLEKMIRDEVRRQLKGEFKKAGRKVSQRIKKHKFTGTYQEMICFCGKEYTAKVADLKRGWALSCSKSCAAKRRKYGNAAAQMKGFNHG